MVKYLNTDTMTIKYFVFCFIVCLVESQTTDHPSDVVRNVKDELQDIGKKISEGFRQVETGVVDEFHKVEHAIKEHPDILNVVKNELEDVGKKISNGFKKAETAVVDEYNKVEHAVEEEFSSIKRAVLNACACTNYNCGCCAHLEQPEIELNATICTNITYLVHDYGISFTVTVNGYAIYNETVSARNPPPVCLGVPYVKELADVCVRLYDVNATTNYLHACVRIEARMKMILIAKYDLGCFNIGPPRMTFDMPGAVGTELDDEDNEIDGMFERTESTDSTQNIPNIGFMLIATSDNEVPATSVTSITDDDLILAKLDEPQSEKTSGLLIPVMASVGAILLISVITLVVYIAIKKRRDEHRSMMQFMKRYGSTTSLVPQMDPYC